MRRSRPLSERIEERVDRSGGPSACHPWLGGRGGLGTPQISSGKRTIAVRRHLYLLEHKSLSSKRLVVMSCGNRDCLNLAHMALRPIRDPVTRFWMYVKRADGDGCWEWTGQRSREGASRRRGAGYGQFMGTWTRIVQAHRYSWELHNGPIPGGMFVCHRCDNPGCVRPDHLFLGTPKDNTDDMVRKGRQVRGPELGAKVRAGRQRVADQRQSEGGER